MLNISTHINIDVKTVQYPIFFDKRNICVHCGSEGSLIFVDKFGRDTKKEIYPFDHIRCTKCNRHFSILLQRDNSNGKMYPSAIDPSFKQEFINLLSTPILKKQGEKEL